VETAGKLIGNLVWAAFLLVVGLVLLRNKPTQAEFDSFIEKEGFVVPTVDRKDLVVAIYYHVRGTWTGEDRSYIGIDHSFIQLPKKK